MKNNINIEPIRLSLMIVFGILCGITDISFHVVIPAFVVVIALIYNLKPSSTKKFWSKDNLKSVSIYTLMIVFSYLSTAIFIHSVSQKIDLYKCNSLTSDKRDECIDKMNLKRL